MMNLEGASGHRGTGRAFPLTEHPQVSRVPRSGGRVYLATLRCHANAPMRCLFAGIRMKCGTAAFRAHRCAYTWVKWKSGARVTRMLKEADGL